MTGPSAHAPLSPSAAARWISCPGSVQACLDHPGDGGETPFADEGTAAHTIAELGLRKRVLRDHGPENEAGYLEWHKRYGARYDLGGMIHDVEPYVKEVERVAEAAGPFGDVALEQRVRVSENIYGTADAVIVSPRGWLHVLDLKFGRGVRVEADGNAQLRIYAAGALLDALVLHEVTEVRMTIVQPRLPGEDGPVRTAVMSSADLLAWKRDMLDAAEARIAAGDGTRAPSEAACRWCTAKPWCPAVAALVAQEVGLTALEGEPDPGSRPVEGLRGEDLAGALEHVPLIEAWCKAVRSSALSSLADDPASVPGWRVTQGRPRRAMTAEAASALVAAGVLAEDEAYPPGLVTLAAAERAAGGRKALASAVGDLLKVTPGAPKLERDE